MQTQQQPQPDRHLSQQHALPHQRIPLPTATASPTAAAAAAAAVATTVALAAQQRPQQQEILDSNYNNNNERSSDPNNLITTSNPPISHAAASQAATYLKLQRMPNGDFIYPDGPAVLYAAGLYLDRNENANSAEAAEPSVMSGSLPQVISPRQLTNSLSSASFKLGADSEGSDIGGDHSLDNTMHQFGQAHHQHLPQQQQHQLSQRSQDSHCTPPEYQHTTSLDESQQHTPGPHRRGSGRRRSKPYDTSPLEDPASANGKPSKSAAAMARLAEGANKQMEELEDELALKRRRNTEAARRSRERKAVRMQALENQVDQLEALNSSMSHKLGLVEKERAIFAVREAELNRRIQTLEASLREAHDALMARAVESMNMNGAGEGPDQRILPAQLAALAAVAISSSDTTPILTTTVGVSAQATSLLDPKIV